MAAQQAGLRSDVQQAEPGWPARIAEARRYAAGRPGVVSFAVVGEDGRFAGGSLPRNRVASASVVKSMLLAAYLNRRAVRDRPLRRSELATLRPMIVRSDDGAASKIFAIVGQHGLRRLAARAGMTRFRPDRRWGLSQIAALDMARFFWHLDELITPRHRGYAMRLLAGIVPRQQWGIPPATPPGWTWRVKGGWIDGVVNQVGLLTRQNRRIALAVLIEGTPDTEERVQHHPARSVGPFTIRGVALRLLRGYR